MINLLPSDIKQERRYARNNRKLVMWLGISLLGIASLFIISAGAFFLLQQAISTEESNNESLTTNLAVQQVDSTIADFKNFSDNLSTVTGILDQQYIFSNLVQRIGGTLPPNSVLSGISLTGEDRTLTLAFNTQDNATANQILVNLNDKQNGLFEQADTLSITCIPEDPSDPSDDNSLLCSTSLKVLFFEDSDFVLLNGLLTEQAFADALNNVYQQNNQITDATTEQVLLDGLKDTYNVSILTSSTIQGRTVINELQNELFSYKKTDDTSTTEELTIPYFSNVEFISEECPGSIKSPTDDNKTYACRTLAVLTINLNPSDKEIQEEEREQDGIDSLQEDFIEAFGTKDKEK